MGDTVTIWTPPSDIVAAADGDVSQYNAETIDNLLHLKESQEENIGGILALSSYDASDSARSATGNSDMVTTADLVSGRAYRIHVYTDVNLGGAGWWTTNLSVNGSNVEQIDNHPVQFTRVNARLLYYASSTSTHTFRVHLVELSGTTTCTLVGSSSSPRRLIVVDLGAQP